jgi:protein-S-isoprenylcysteine O-methyltransferase Ste14
MIRAKREAVYRFGTQRRAYGAPGVTDGAFPAILALNMITARPFLAIYLLGLSIGSAILARHARRKDRAAVMEDLTTPLDRALTGLSALGMFVAPVVFAYTPWLAWGDYDLGRWALLPGGLLFGLGLWLLWRAHVDLGRYWSAGLQIRQGQRVMTGGVFRHIRHPLYAGYLLWGLAQPWLIHNWVAGLSMLATFLPVYLYRVGREERMMARRWREYAAYAEATDRLWPVKSIARLLAGERCKALRWLRRS